MTTTTDPLPAAAPGALPSVLSWPRVRFVLVVAVVYGLLGAGAAQPMALWMLRAFIVGLLAVLAFGLFERRPRALPRWFARWALQLGAVVLLMPFAVMFAFSVTGGLPDHLSEADRRGTFFRLFGPAVLLTPVMVFSALMRQREALAREQAMRFQLERSELERQAADARLRLLQAQVQPHFLFNTLANVRALVKAGAPEAPAVLDSLIAYLRATVPRIQEAEASMADEIALVRAYLELMHMRMPDRLQFTVHADDAALRLHCPPVSLLTLVENAVRHGIDPSEEGGRIEVHVSVRSGRVLARVIDTGAGLRSGDAGGGTGLAMLRERLQLAFGDAQLRLSALAPHGACAEIEFPAREAASA